MTPEAQLLRQFHIERMVTDRPFEIDWIERETERLLAKARRSGFFRDVIEDARQIQDEHGYAWDVALSKSCAYWCWDPRTAEEN